MSLLPHQTEIINLTKGFVKLHLADAEGGHDWWHIYRVWQLVKRIAKTEDVDLFVVELTALLHDIADPKFHDGDEEIGPQVAEDFLQEQNIDQSTIDHVINIIRNMSFKSSLDSLRTILF